MRSALSTVAAASALFGATSAHLHMQSPVPIEGNAIKDPLDASGDNFPCHGATLPTSGGASWAAGSSQLLEFDVGAYATNDSKTLVGGPNTAVHGGGSCQISITYETDTDKVKDPSNWHVIYSIEGGCPSSTKGNLDGQYTGPKGPYSGSVQCSDPRSNGVDCVNSFDFKVPEGVKNGHAIMAWTWFNNVGNREMYMNCANVQITGGTGDEMDSLPAMYLANVAPAPTTCNAAYTNLAFPNPGKYATTITSVSGGNTYPLATPTGAGCGSASGGSAAAPTGYGSGSDSSADAPSSSAYAAPSSAQSASLPAYQTQPAASYATDAPVVTATTMMTVTADAPAYTAPAAASPSPDTPSLAAPDTNDGAATNNNASTSSGSMSCTTDGSVVCIGTTQFGLCNGSSAVAQDLAPGTSCSNGVISKRRVIRHAAKHIGAKGHSHNM